MVKPVMDIDNSSLFNELTAEEARINDGFGNLGGFNISERLNPSSDTLTALLQPSSSFDQPLVPTPFLYDLPSPSNAVTSEPGTDTKSNTLEFQDATVEDELLFDLNQPSLVNFETNTTESLGGLFDDTIKYSDPFNDAYYWREQQDNSCAFSLQLNNPSLGSEKFFKPPTLEAVTSFFPAQQSAGPASSSLSSVFAGTLRADTFTVNSGFDFAVVSGNGNIDFGSGARDLLDLSSISSSTVKFNYAEASSGGVLYNPGNGTRVFDSLILSDGSNLLFEGIDQIQFADKKINTSLIPDDPLFSEQWNLHMMGVHNAWYFTQGSDEVLIGVQDTGLGVDSSGNIHPDLGNTLNYIDNVSDDHFLNFPGQNEQKPNSHGTGVQGIIAAASDNGIGMSGINWNSDVFNIDVLDYNSSDQTLAQATQNMIDYADSSGQQVVINMSLGYSFDSDFEQLVANNQDDALFVIATGNGSQNGGDSSLSYPAVLASVYDNVIAVGASWGTHDAQGNPTTPGERISYPGAWGSNYGQGITLMGPSEVISTSANSSSGFGYWGDGSQPAFDGTSAATPNVAGVASLVWSANSDLAADEIKTILSQTAYDLGTPGYDLVYGHGFVNADAAVRRAMALGTGDPLGSAMSDSLSVSPNFAMNPVDLLAV